MKKIGFLCVCVIGIFVALQATAQDQINITVKASEVSGTVVLVTGQQISPSGKPMALELQCTKGMTGCATLESGNYIMVRLPKNHGVYDCQDVDIYASSSDPQKDEKLGEYCLNQK